MPKQICFFASLKDIELLIHHIYSLNAVIIDYTGKPLTKEDILQTDNYNCHETISLCKKALITKPGFSLCYRTSKKNTQIEPYASEVVEFSFCTPVPQKIIDTSSVDEIFRKDGFIVIDDLQKYNQLMEQLMVNPTYVKNPNYIENGFEHGRFWCSSVFLNSDGKQVKKAKDFDVLFNNLKKFIQKNFLLSKDKFAYIGPDAYEKYLLGTFVPCSGKNRIIYETNHGTVLCPEKPN